MFIVTNLIHNGMILC